MSETLTAARLREVLDYDQVTGIFKWKVKPNRRICIGDIAGSAGKKGRICIHIDGKGYFAHRLAWLYVHGAFPTNQIDHELGDPSSNGISNLRDVTPLGNSQNLRGPTKANTTGYLGVAKGRRGNFVARIKVNKKALYLGEHKTPEAAYAAYIAAKRIHHPTCTI